jgi:NosR/NirI family nitrous oxide reductase transcriptional regulator
MEFTAVERTFGAPVDAKVQPVVARSFGLYAFALLVLLLPFHAVNAQSRLGQFLPRLTPAEIFPGADRFGPVEGKPPTAGVFAADRLVGYAYLNSDIVNAAGYSGKPIDIVIGLSLAGRITGAKLVEHHEPIVLVGIAPAKIESFIHGYVGRNFADTPSVTHTGAAVDIVSGATVSAMVIGDSITRSSIIVARARHLGQAGQGGLEASRRPVRQVDEMKSTVESWAALLADGSVRRLHLSIMDINRAFEQSGNVEAKAHPDTGNPDDTFIDLYVAVVSVPSIGRSLLGEGGWNELRSQLKPGQQALLVGSDGIYSYKGSGYVRGGIFDRIEVIQGENSIRFHDHDQQRLQDLAAAGAPRLNEISLFIIPQEMAFDPAAAWRLQLLVQRAMGARDKAFLTFDEGYALPDKYLTATQTARATPEGVTPTSAPRAASSQEAQPGQEHELLAEPIWHRLWRTKLPQVIVLLVSLVILAGVFFFQDALVRRPVLYDRFRLLYLAFTLVWLGWYAKAQLSVVNVLTFVNALRTDFRWDYFLMEPLIFILWTATATSILFWNRGAFCGWLCPFGALQELLNRGARALHLPQVRVPFGLHQRLWVLKYVIFIALLGVSFYELAIAERMAEVEPFKTAIVLYFMRGWPFVTFAGALLGASLFIERFFCRYLCPLGAALAIPARLRMFDWLRRYRECGNPCQRCANDCPVQAIHPEGHINPNECIQCLHCQMLYHHDRKCPVMIQKRLKREKAMALSTRGGAAPTSAGGGAPAEEVTSS